MYADLCTAQDVQLSYATDDTFGAVTGGYLDLRGYLSPVHLSRSNVNSRYEGTLEPAILDHGLDRYCVLINLDVGNGAEVGTSEIEASLFFCMLVRAYNAGTILTMLLLKLVDHEEGLFERVGIAITPMDSDRTITKDKLDNLLSLLEEQTSLPCRSQSEGLHTIRII